MKYELIKKINDETFLGSSEDELFVLKEIPLSDTEIYKKLISLECKNIVKFYETVNIDGKFYAVEEYINGITLSNCIDSLGCFDENATKEITMQVCSGLKEIHKLGIVHRDINPNNVMITKDGEAKIIDFGISRITKSNQNRDTEILGTQGYTAPEQFGFHQTNDKADIYSVGVLVNYMLTGKLPNEELTKSWLSEIVLKCIQIDELNRYSDIDELMHALQNKSKINHIIKTIPGFRKGIWWHSAIAGVYYFALILLIVSFIYIAKTPLEIVANLGFIVFTFIVPVIILLDFNNWTKRYEFIKNKTKPRKIILQLVLTCVSMVISAIFILLD